MKTIYLVRHAESGWENSSNDFERTLTPKGLKDARYISDKLSFKTDIIIASPAKRTTETSIIFANALNYPLDKINFEETIYEAPLRNLIAKINKISTNNNTAILIGHNPGITELTNYLTSDNISPVQPCSVIKIELEIDDWNEIIEGVGSIKLLIHPSL